MKLVDENKLDLSSQTFLDDVLTGLSHQPKYLSPKWFYDHTGANLFEKICDVPEYYLTRTEREILEMAAPAIARELGSNAVLIEYGSGAMTKVKLLLDAINRPYAFVAVDIASGQLKQAAADLIASYPELRVQTIAADFTNVIYLPNWLHSAGRCCVFFPGSTIGNFEPNEIREFLRRLHRTVGKNGALLIGVDLKKDNKSLEAAYNDSSGLTAQFNKNILRRINHELNGDICLNSFQHLAWYNSHKGRIEMHLKSRIEQSLSIAGHKFHFKIRETIHTENCYKFTVPEFQSIAIDSGFRPTQVWTDTDNIFSIHLFDAN